MHESPSRYWTPTDGIELAEDEVECLGCAQKWYYSCWVDYYCFLAAVHRWIAAAGGPA